MSVIGDAVAVWICEDCKETDVVGSIAELKIRLKVGNKYFVMRHGEAESNVKAGMHGVVSSREENRII